MGKTRSWKIFTSEGRCVFFFSPQLFIASGKNAFGYDNFVPEQTVYAYALSNPLTNIDPDGLQTIPWDLPWVDEPITSAPTQMSPTVPTTSDPVTAIPDTPGTDFGDPKNCDPCKGLRNQVAEHEQKLANYIADPYKYDNKGLLGKGRDPQVIAGRIKKLLREINGFKIQLADCERRNGII